MRALCQVPTALIIVALLAQSAAADSVFFNSGDPDGLMAMASRPSSAGKIEIEAADDFVLTTTTQITSATFTGLLPTNGSLADIADVRVEIYRVFPLDSTVPPSDHVPTRTNSPSDVEFADRSASANNLTFKTTSLASTFSALNSVLNGIHPSPGFHTGGDGAVTGREVQFNASFSTPFTLDPNHYFFVPQVQLTNGDFFWLSAPRPIVSPGTPFPSGFNDLQAWIRNEDLDPDWLRVGTDIVGGSPAPTFNAAFSLTGQSVPEPSSVILLGAGLVVLAARWRMQYMRYRYVRANGLGQGFVPSGLLVNPDSSAYRCPLE
jgi:PEP-CTERM motif